MLTVRCPACNERIEGMSSEDLSWNVRSHLSEVHDVETRHPESRASTGAEMNVGHEEGIGRRRDAPSREPRGPPPRPVSPTPGGGVGPGAKVDIEEKSFELSSTGGSEDTRGISEFQCPLCDTDIKGRSEEELTLAFRNHLTTEHRDEPFVTYLMERVGSR